MKYNQKGGLRVLTAACLVIVLCAVMIVPALADITVNDNGLNLDTFTLSSGSNTYDLLQNEFDVPVGEYTLTVVTDDDPDTLAAPSFGGEIGATVTGSGSPNGATRTYTATVADADTDTLSINVDTLTSYTFIVTVTADDPDVLQENQDQNLTISFGHGETWSGNTNGSVTYKIGDSSQSDPTYSMPTGTIANSATVSGAKSGYTASVTDWTPSSTNIAVEITVAESPTTPTTPGTSTGGNKADGTRVSNYNAGGGINLGDTFTVKEGGNRTWSGEGSLSFTVDGVTVSQFRSATIDGQALSADNYDLRSGSVILTLNESYLRTLSNGTHKLEMRFDGGYATGAFQVTNNAPADGGQDQGSGTGNGNTNQNPGTGTTSSIPAALAAVGLVALAAGMRKK